VRELELEPGKKYQMITLASKPPIFGKKLQSETVAIRFPVKVRNKGISQLRVGDKGSCNHCWIF